MNPILAGDFPDPDVIRVDDTYYMVSTTMHFMPGAAILRSYDLVNWEFVSHVYDKIEDTPGYQLQSGQNAYGQGMWAPCIRYHDGFFYVNFSVNDLHKTFLYKARNVEGPWERQEIEGFYYDSSILFDDDGRVYIVHGNRNIWITELNEDLTAPKEGGLRRNIVNDLPDINLGYEGSHIYKIRGKYYLFNIHWPKMRTESCFMADSLEGEFVGRDVLEDDMGYHNQGVAQGGIVDTPDGDWYAILFQDHGAVGRIPILLPVTWEDDWPVFGVNGRVPDSFEVHSTRPDYQYKPLYCSDDFSQGIGEQWEWNHNPVNAMWSTEGTGLTLATDRVVERMTQSVNTLTMRMRYPSCTCDITVDGSDMKVGDHAGICALQSCYGLIALVRDAHGYHLEMGGRQADAPDLLAMPEETGVPMVYGRCEITNPVIRLRVAVDFTDQIDEAHFFYEDQGKWKQLGNTQKLYFKIDHFTGCRAGLFYYSTQEMGGKVNFEDFIFLE